MPRRLTKKVRYIRLPEKRIAEIDAIVASWSNETKEFMRARGLTEQEIEERIGRASQPQGV